MSFLKVAGLLLSIIVGLWFIWEKVLPWFRPPAVREKDLVALIREGRELLARSEETPLPFNERNAWVARMENYFRMCGATGLAARLSNFDGLTFHGDGSKRFKFQRSIDGCLRRLNEFLSEL